MDRLIVVNASIPQQIEEVPLNSKTDLGLREAL
jgi:hypothetical protein